jgi:hypothetical protein
MQEIVSKNVIDSSLSTQSRGIINRLQRFQIYAGVQTFVKFFRFGYAYRLLVLHKVDGILSGNFNYVVVDPRRSTA